MEEDKLVHVYTVLGPLQGEMIRAFLESKGITAVVEEESAGVAIGIEIAPLGRARVYVPETQVEEAKEVLAALDRGEYDLPYDANGDEEPGSEEENS